MNFQNFIANFPSNNPFKKYSQTGEEGILDYIFQNIGTTNKFLVDLGAGNGVRLSNTHWLLQEKGWQGVRIDQNAANDVKPARITRENICQLLSDFEVPETFDLLSMDLDGNDFWILAEVIKQYKPLVLVVEVNGCLPANVSQAIAYNPDHNHQDNDYYGASHEAFNRLLTDYVGVFNQHNLNLFYIHKDVVGDVSFDLEQKCTPYHHHLPNGNWVQNPETLLTESEPVIEETPQADGIDDGDVQALRMPKADFEKYMAGVIEPASLEQLHAMHKQWVRNYGELSQVYKKNSKECIEAKRGIELILNAIKEHESQVSVTLKNEQPVNSEPVEEPEINATDAAIELAIQHKIVLADVKGTGRNGRITVGDVRALIKE